MPHSIHTARWIEQLDGQNWNIHLFPSIIGTPLHPKIRNVTFHNLAYSHRITVSSNVKYGAFGLIRRGIGVALRYGFAEFFPSWHGRFLARTVQSLRPDIVHSMEIQSAGYLTLSAKKRVNDAFPPWIVTNWGSDIYIFGRLEKHKQKIRAVLASCDYYSCECNRDVALAKEFGYQKTVLPVMPNGGGFDLLRLDPIRHRIAPSNRKLIMLKGYQGWAGRALVGLRALERCAAVLMNYSVVIYAAAPEVAIAAELFTSKTGISTCVLPVGTSHDDILAYHSQARISIGLSIGDAISTSLLEAMVMGSYPIQSCTACADEWVVHGASASIVPPEDPDIVETAIRVALADDKLVDNASQINWRVAQARLDSATLRGKAVQMYRNIMK